MAIGGVKLWPVARAIVPFVLMMLVVLMLVTYVPAFALALVALSFAQRPGYVARSAF